MPPMTASAQGLDDPSNTPQDPHASEQQQPQQQQKRQKGWMLRTNGSTMLQAASTTSTADHDASSAASSSDQDCTTYSSMAGSKLHLVAAKPISMHYFVEHKKREVLSYNSQAEADLDPEACPSDEVPEPTVPNRIRVSTHMYISGATLAILLALLIFGYYNSTVTMLRLKAYYASVVYIILPLGLVFFSFACATVVRGAFSLLLGKSC